MDTSAIGTPRRGKAAALLPLLSIHMSKLYKQTGWPVRLKIIPSLRSVWLSDKLNGVNQSVVHRGLANVFSRMEVPVWYNKFRDLYFRVLHPVARNIKL
jgi:hypothetical protein